MTSIELAASMVSAVLVKGSVIALGTLLLARFVAKSASGASLVLGMGHGALGMGLIGPWLPALGTGYVSISHEAIRSVSVGGIAVPPVYVAIAVWAAGVLLMLGRLINDLRAARAIVGRAEGSGQRVEELLKGAARAVGCSRIPEMRESSELATAALIGFWRPVLLIPLNRGRFQRTADICRASGREYGNSASEQSAPIESSTSRGLKKGSMSSMRSKRSRDARRGPISRSEQGAIARSSRRAPRNEGSTRNEVIREGSGNVFIDLGFGAEEAASLKLRSSLMIALEQKMVQAGATQADFAARLGVSQPRISDLVRGKVDRFSVDTLIDLLTRVGAEVRVTVV